MRTTFITIMAVLFSSAMSARAQDDAIASDPAGILLSGPAVEAEPTLVRYGLDGRLERLEGRSEIAAAELVLASRGADDALAARVRAIAAARLDAVRLLLVDELDAVRTISDLTIAGEAEAARDELRALWQRFEPGRPHAPLLAAIVEALGPERGARVRGLVDAYWAALLAERMGGRLERRMSEAMAEANAMDDDAPDRMAGDRPDPALVMASDDPVIAAARDRLAFQLFQREVRYAYDQSLSRYRELLDSIDEAVQPTEVQRAGIREIVLEHIKETRFEATPAQRRETMLAVYRELDETRRERLYGLLLRQVVPD